jgi:hypothetical protein
MTTPETPAQALTDRLGRVRAGWPGAKWEWDGRLGCALSALTKADEAKAREALAAGLPSIWTSTTLAEAPAALQAVCARVGGLRSDQQVFSVALDGGALAYCLWWPWGGGANFSARIGATSDELLAVVRAALGVK